MFKGASGPGNESKDAMDGEGEGKGEGDASDNGKKSKQKSPKIDETERKKLLAEKKSRKKAEFNAGYDDEKTFYDEVKSELNVQKELNKAEFEGDDDEMRVQFEGFRPGLYVRIEISSLPHELIDNFDPHYPVICGGLLPNESAMGYVHLRFKKHRWYKKILKTRDPIILSVGWRRFETIPLYAVEDHNGRNRLLKYTPEHMHCLASFYGL